MIPFFQLSESYKKAVFFFYNLKIQIFSKYLMLEWLFGSKKEEKKVAKQDELGKDEKWTYDYIKQYLTSPIWRNPLLDFIEEHCPLFEDVEENKFQYTKIFQQFTGLCALLLESMLEEVGISEKTLEKCIIKGLRSEKDHKIFQQILLCDNFSAFKKIMIAKNKELDVQALKSIQKHAPKEQQASHDKQIEIDAMELERLQLEKAIAMSLALDEKAQTQEQKELEQAIKLSQLEFEKEVKKVEEKPEKKKLLGQLPPLALGTTKANRPVEEFKKEESKLKQEIDDLKKKQQQRRLLQQKDQQNSQERKKRLLEQRELIRKKKQQERKQQLTTFVSSVQNPSEEAPKVSEQELERRRSLMKKLREQLKE